MQHVRDFGAVWLRLAAKHKEGTRLIAQVFFSVCVMCVFVCVFVCVCVSPHDFGVFKGVCVLWTDEIELVLFKQGSLDWFVILSTYSWELLGKNSVCDHLNRLDSFTHCVHHRLLYDDLFHSESYLTSLLSTFGPTVNMNVSFFFFFPQSSNFQRNHHEVSGKMTSVFVCR